MIEFQGHKLVSDYLGDAEHYKFVKSCEKCPIRVGHSLLLPFLEGKNLDDMVGYSYLVTKHCQHGHFDPYFIKEVYRIDGYELCYGNAVYTVYKEFHSCRSVVGREPNGNIILASDKAKKFKTLESMSKIAKAGTHWITLLATQCVYDSRREIVRVDSPEFSKLQDSMIILP